MRATPRSGKLCLPGQHDGLFYLLRGNEGGHEVIILHPHPLDVSQEKLILHLTLGAGTGELFNPLNLVVSVYHALDNTTIGAAEESSSAPICAIAEMGA